MIDRAEVILHDSFGDAEYWMVISFTKTSLKVIFSLFVDECI